MRRMFALIWAIMSAIYPLSGQDQERMEYVMRLLDSEIEDVDGEEVERLFELLRKPIELNRASLSEITSSGLFSRYQVASLIDYRSRSGDVMSYLELAAIDGFGNDFVRRIRPFISIEPHSVKSIGRVDHSVLMRSAFKHKDRESRYSYDTRYKIGVGERLSAAIGISKTIEFSCPRPDNLSGYLQWRLRKSSVKFILGDFNARFGQGISLWNGMTPGALNSPSSFMRRSSGLTPSASLTGKYAFTGVASEFIMGRFALSLMTAFPGVKQYKSYPDKVQMTPAVNLTCNWKNGQWGFTHYTGFSGLRTGIFIPEMKTSADIAMCVKGIDLFSEIGYDWVESSITLCSGVVLPIVDAADVAVMTRLSREEYALSMSSSLLTGKWMRVNGKDMSQSRVEGTFSSEMIFYPIPKSDDRQHSLQLKFHTQWHWVVSKSFRLALRVTERLRSWGLKSRTDVRSDMYWSGGGASVAVRFNVLRCRNVSFLTYAEGGYEARKLGLHLRQGLFIVDHWDDRIYAYERDVPGSFNVPAYYGRGVWTSFMTSWRFARCGKLYCHVGYTVYPFMKEKKPGRAELRLQCVLDF